ncbi:MAG: lipopolysaccharide biosynthesis protein [Bacillota bacterium]
MAESINNLRIKKINIKEFLSDTSRSGKAKRNIIVLFVLHSFTLLFSLLMVPLSLRCLNPVEYGTWLTVSSITTWFVSLDFGLGNGLRNKLSEAFAFNDRKLARIYVSSTYFIITLIVFLCYIVFIIINHWLNWLKILNAPESLASELNPLVLFVFTFFFAQFILKLIVYIVLADQKPAINGLFSFLINLFTVIALYMLSKGSSSSLFTVGFISSLIPMLVFLLASVILFAVYYKDLIPSIKLVKLEHAKNLVQLGFQFFVIQIASLIIFTTDNIIITQIFTPAEVTIYNVAYKYFSIIPLVFGVILTPFWSAYTEALAKKDYFWIRRNIQKLIKIWVIFALLILIMLLISGGVYKIWTESKVQVPFILSVLMGLFSIISMWNNIFAYFVNGAGKIRLQMYVAGIGGIVNIPLSIFLARNLQWGVAGIIAATSICLLLGSVLVPLQSYKIINQKADGIWNK